MISLIVGRKYANGTHFINLKVGKFKLHWFTDCGDWFIYIGRKRIVRFSSAGFMTFKINK